MSDPVAYRTVLKCVKSLEVALKYCDRDTVDFLYQEGLITVALHDEVLSPRSPWTALQKAEELVAGIKGNVKLSAQSFQTLLKHLRQSGKHYEEIVKILDDEYSRQQLTGTLCRCTVQSFEHSYIIQ